MAKNKGGNEAPKTKKGPDITGQKVKKAKNAFKSGGKRGLLAYLANNTDIKGNKTVEALLKQAQAKPDKPPKGKRGPKSVPKAQPEPVNA